MGFLVVAAVAVALVLFSALFSAMETAFFSLKPAQLRRLRERQPALAGRLEGLLSNPRRLLSALLLADVCSNLPLIILCLMGMEGLAHRTLPFIAAALGIFALVVILCDLLPKLAALYAPVRTAAAGAPVMTALLPVFDPFCRVLQQASERVAGWLTPASMLQQKPLDEGELETLIQIGAEEGALLPTESEIIQEILKLGNKTARDCMLPRLDVFSIPDDLSNDEAVARLRAKRFRRVPVYAHTPDNLLGTLDVQRFLLHPEAHYTEMLTPPSYVPETMRALDLLRNFLRHTQRLAIVVDEFGGTEGIVTLNDIVEHLLADALPSSSQELYIENFGAGRLIVAGDARLDDLSERLGQPLEAEGIDTIGGLVFNHLGYLPKPGETVELDGMRVTVRRASRKRIQEVLVEPKGMDFTPPEPEGGEATP